MPEPIHQATPPAKETTTEAPKVDGDTTNTSTAHADPVGEDVFAVVNNEKFKTKEDLVKKSSQAFGKVADLTGELKKEREARSALEAELAKKQALETPKETEIELPDEDVKYIKNAAQKAGFLTKDEVDAYLQTKIEERRAVEEAEKEKQILAEQEAKYAKQLEDISATIPEIKDKAQEIIELTSVSKFRERMAKADNSWEEGYKIWQEINGIVEKKTEKKDSTSSPTSTSAAPTSTDKKPKSTLDAYFLAQLGK